MQQLKKLPQEGGGGGFLDMVPFVEAVANVRRRGGGRIFRYGSFCRSHG